MAMHHRLAAVAALALLLAWPLRGECAAPKDDRIDGPELVALLQDAGYRAKLDTDKEGEPLVRTRMSGVDVDVFFYDCKAHRCGSLQLSTALDLKDGTTPAVINAFNRHYRYAHAYLDDENDPFLQFDFEVVNTIHAGYIASQLDTWEQLLGAFFEATGFNGGTSAAPAAPAPAGHVLGLRRDVSSRAQRPVRRLASR